MTVLGIPSGFEWMSEENLFHNQEVESIMKKVFVEVDPIAESIFAEEKGLAIPSAVEIKTHDGRLFKETEKYSKGTPKNPFTIAELKAKFKLLASSRFSNQRIENMIELVSSMETLKDISILTKLLRNEKI
jgi:2-methylcitrate dehydratase PrpD